MPVRADCRHYAERTALSNQEKIQRCRLDVADLDPFACPEGCLFFEERKISDAGWTVERRRDS
ncbi:MAG TPA: hypothetical protein VGO92_07690 [Acidimicrobiales bacterium]|jgi:hypothetical protein|nr:hypothetical protein [Acidimicrobiales bacterium]